MPQETQGRAGYQRSTNRVSKRTLAPLLRKHLSQYSPVDVRVDLRLQQLVQLVRVQGFDLPLHWVVGVETVAGGEARPPRVALLPFGGRQAVRAALFVGEQDCGRSRNSALALIL
ncbi:hypothetical protein [Kitasatospora sp. NPDC085879]|uniref:hypothetical protein n=1 Tax=Kitasatospora sp. NPDC085879 TaxID=3154769 RepID=UPI000BC3DBFB|nr:hypothetical protein [Streptomyces sp. TLI_235]PBC69910.1 hypothetical protein BX265_7281 [Streptomyces sp. TLI_235]